MAPAGDGRGHGDRVPRIAPAGGPEPAKPEPAEDDGWVLCLEWNGARCASDLVILAAASMKELAVMAECF